MPRRPKNPSTRPLRLDLVRAAVLEVYGAVRAEGHLADRALDRVLRRESRLFSSERRAVAEGVYGLLRHERRIDRALFGTATPTLGPAALFPLRYAGLLVLEGADPAQIASSHGLGPAFAARLPLVRQALPERLPAVERVALEGSLPEFVAARLIADLGEAHALGFARAIGTRAPLTVRANLLRADRATLARRLAQEGVEARETRYSPWGLSLSSHINAFGLPSFKEGFFEVQDEGSQLLALSLGARPGERVVDACAGAGGKTLALAAEMKNRGELWALDVDASRLAELSRRARRAGLSNVRVLAVPPDATADEQLKALMGKADRVLIDAPCTGLGAMRRNPDARYRMKPDDFDRYAARQTEILARFARLARPGGRVVYATCSVARAEDEAVVEAFFASQPPFQVRPAAEVLPVSAPELFEGPYLRLSPHKHGTDGFFAAVLERQKA